MVMPLLILLTVVVAPANAQSPDALAAGRELMTTMRVQEQFRALMPIIISNLKPAIVQGRPEVERDFDLLTPLILETIGQYDAPMIEATARVYAANFDVDELREISAFFRKPVGLKFLEKMPTLMQQGMAAGSKIGEVAAQDLRKRIVDALRKKGHKI
jgi:hypothetical protein